MTDVVIKSALDLRPDGLADIDDDPNRDNISVFHEFFGNTRLSTADSLIQGEWCFPVATLLPEVNALVDYLLDFALSDGDLRVPGGYVFIQDGTYRCGTSEFLLHREWESAFEHIRRGPSVYDVYDNQHSYRFRKTASELTVAHRGTVVFVCGWEDFERLSADAVRETSEFKQSLARELRSRLGTERAQELIVEFCGHAVDEP